MNSLEPTQGESTTRRLRAPGGWRGETWAKAVLIGGPDTVLARERAGLRVLVVGPPKPAGT